MKQPSYYRARIAFIEKHIKEAAAKEVKEIFALGYIGEGYQSIFLEYIAAHEPSMDNSPLTPSEIMAYDTFFAMHPEKVAGKAQRGSGFMRRVEYKGTMQDVEALFVDLPNTEITESTKEPVKEKEPVPKKEPVKEKELRTNEIRIVAEAVEIVKQSKKDEAPKGKVLSFADSIKKYNSAIPKAEIKAWVWYQRRFGNPMKGWEDYYLGESNSQSKVAYAKESVTLKDNSWADIHSVPEGAFLGVPNKKEHEYNGVTYAFVRNEEGTVYLVDKSKIEIKTGFNEATETALKDLVEQKALVWFDGEYLPIPVFLYGNIYERLDSIKKAKESIVAKFSEEIYNWSLTLLEASKPKMLVFDDANKSKRPIILSKSQFANDVTKIGVTELKEDTGVTLARSYYTMRGEPFTLYEAFVEWFKETITDNDLKDTTKDNIINYYFASKPKWAKIEVEEDGVTKSKDQFSKEQKLEYITLAKIEAEHWFGEFLATALLPDDIFKLNLLWNMEFNSVSDMNANRVPIAFQASATFKNKLYGLRPVQRNGLAYMSLKGSGCLAYDVGYGKTMTAIAHAAMMLSTGKAKRICIAVPKPTYTNWRKELFGFYKDGKKTAFTSFKGAEYVTGILSHTNVNVLDWSNLGVEVFKKQNIQNEQIPSNSIVLVTHEGLGAIGYSETLMKDLFSELRNVVMQDSVDDSARDQTKKELALEALIGLGNSQTRLDIDTLGIDAFIVDEAHNFKNVFTKVGKNEDGKNLFGIQSAQSVRAIKLYFLTNYIQRKYSGNVCFLTATPFQNSPLEIYSMLSMIGYASLKKYGVQNIVRFFETFISETIEYAVNVKGELTAKPVIKGYSNKLLLQKILYNHFDYRNNPEEAGIKRPCKVVLPLTKERVKGQLVPLAIDKQITTYLDMTERQKVNQEQVAILANSVSRTNPGAMFKAMNMSLNNALSPFLVDGDEPNSPEDFVHESPKIHYACECIKAVKKYHESRNEDVSGQIIYSNRGKDFYPYIKDYLIQDCDFERGIKYGRATLDEVEIITSDTSDTRKEIIKEAFLDGTVKVLIATSTIKEGVNLQQKGTVIHNLLPDWNPTGIAQLYGRIHRQGNEYGWVIMSNPLLANSMDAFIYQKLEEKSARIGSIWNRDGANSMDEDGIDPNEIKFALINDPGKLVEMTLTGEIRQAENKLRVATENLETYGNLRGYIHYYSDTRTKLIDDLKTRLPKIKTYLSSIKNLEEGIKDKDSHKEVLKAIKDVKPKLELQIEDIEAFLTSEMTDVRLFEIYRSLKSKKFIYDEFTNKIRIDYYLFTVPQSLINSHRDHYKKVIKAEKDILIPLKFTIHDDLTPIKKKLEEEVLKATKFVDHLKSDENKNKVREEIEAELESRNSIRGTIESQVDKFKSIVHLLSYKSDNVDKELCEMPTTECCQTNGKIEKEEPRIDEVEIAIAPEPVIEQNIDQMIEALKISIEFLEGENKTNAQTQLEALEIAKEFV